MTTDECARIEELISAQQDGATTPEEQATIERHVAGCARCQATVAAFGQVDRQVRRYLMATPVPEIATPWRNEPIPLPVRRGGGLGHWRVTAVGLAAIFVMLFTASILAFQPFTPTQSQTAGGRPPGESVSGGNAPAAALIAATATPAAAFSAPAAPPQPSTAAAARSAAGSAAPSTAPQAGGAAAGSAASSAPSSAPAGTPERSAAVAAAPTGTSAPVPAAGVAAGPNPAQLYRLREAITLLICQADCATQPQPDAVLTAVVAALDRPLAPLAPASAASTPGPYVTLRFVRADGTTTDLGYYPQAQRLQLPDGRGLVAAPQALVDALAPIIPR